MNEIWNYLLQLGDGSLIHMGSVHQEHCNPLKSYLTQNSPNLASGPASSYPVTYVNQMRILYAIQCVPAMILLCQIWNMICYIEPSPTHALFSLAHLSWI